MGELDAGIDEGLLGLSRQMGDAQGVIEILIAVPLATYARFNPRDFDLSPYFRIITPVEALAFDYRALVWNDQYRAENGDGSPHANT